MITPVFYRRGARKCSERVLFINFNARAFRLRAAREIDRWIKTNNLYSYAAYILLNIYKFIHSRR